MRLKFVSNDIEFVFDVTRETTCDQIQVGYEYENDGKWYVTNKWDARLAKSVFINGKCYFSGELGFTIKKDLSVRVTPSRALEDSIALACERNIIAFIDANREELDREAERTVERLIDEEIKDREKDLAELVEHKKKVLKRCEVNNEILR